MEKNEYIILNNEGYCDIQPARRHSEQIVYEATHNAFFYGDIQSTKIW